MKLKKREKKEKKPNKAWIFIKKGIAMWARRELEDMEALKDE